MSSLLNMTRQQLIQREETLRQQYMSFKAQGLQLDMSRGKPGVQQLDLSLEMMECVNPRDGYTAESGFDARNYGVLDGLPEVKSLFADILGVTPDPSTRESPRRAAARARSHGWQRKPSAPRSSLRGSRSSGLHC